MTTEPPISSTQLAIENARVVTPDRVIPDGHVRIDEDRIAAVEAGSASATVPTIDAGGHLVLPGLIDLHGDDLERHRFPREEATVDDQTALLGCDRATVAAGITTKFHAVAFENAPPRQPLGQAREGRDRGARDGRWAPGRQSRERPL